MKLWILSLGLAFVGATGAYSEETNSCVLLQRLASNLGCVGTTPGNGGDKNFSDDVMSNSFGSDQCSLGKALEDTRASQKKECQAWLNSQKKELGSRYVTGTCKPECSPCPDTMQKCTTRGEVRYRLDNRK